MEDDFESDVVLNDELQWVFVSRLTKKGRARAAKIASQRRFEEQWEEKDDTDQNADGNQHDIERVLNRLGRLPGCPDMQVAFSTIFLDRVRRLAFGYIKPPPMSMMQGKDGGIDTSLFRQRRPRPADDDHGLAGTATSCPLPESNRIHVRPARRRRPVQKQGKKRVQKRRRQIAAPPVQLDPRRRAIALAMLQQPRSAVIARAMRRL